jgi:hypothetical protein
MKVQGLGASPASIGFTGFITFAVDGTTYMVPVPSAVVNFVPGLSVATTSFCNGHWTTNVPLSGLSGNVFLDGFALQAPMPGGFPGGIHDVTWQGTFFSVTPGLKVQWQWGGRGVLGRELRHRLQRAPRQAGGRQPGKHLPEFRSRRDAREREGVRDGRREGRRRIEFHRLVQRHRIGDASARDDDLVVRRQLAGASRHR